MLDHQIKLAKSLRKFAKSHGLREDWHEPDEQGVSAFMIGNHLDNAFGDRIVQELVERNSQEFVVVLTCGKDRLQINLASLLATAAQCE